MDKIIKLSNTQFFARLTEEKLYIYGVLKIIFAPIMNKAEHFLVYLGILSTHFAVLSFDCFYDVFYKQTFLLFM